MEYEYVALKWTTDHWMQDEAFLRDEMDLLDRGWEEDSRAGRVCIMRRPKDEPRMWTEAEIEEIAKRYYWRRAKEESNG